MSKVARARKGSLREKASLKSLFISEAVAETDGKRSKYAVTQKTDTTRICVPVGLDSTWEGTYKLKRKSISVNAESHKPTSLGLSVFGANDYQSTMSKQEKRVSRKKLKLELKQVLEISFRIEAKILQLRGSGSAAGHACNSGHLSRIDGGGSAEKEVSSVLSRKFDTARSFARENQIASSDVAMSDDNLSAPGWKEKRLPKANQMYLNSEYVSGNQKMPVLDKGKPNVGAKRPLQEKVTSDLKRQRLEQAQSKAMADIMKQCGTLLRKLMTHKHGWVFNEPVDAVKLGLPDYHKVIHSPMDLGTIKNKLSSGVYGSPVEFAEDVRLTFANAMKYNPEGHDVHIMAGMLRLIFEEKWKCIGEKIKEGTMNGIGVQVDTQESLDWKPKADKGKGRVAPSSKSRSAVERVNAHGFPEREMTFNEKKLLTEKIQNISGDVMEQVIYLLRRSRPDLVQDGADIEVDLDSIDGKTLWELDHFLTRCANSDGKPDKFTFEDQQLQNEDEIAAKASYSQSKGLRGEPMDESVDIGGQVASPLHIVGTDSDPESPSASDSDAGDAQAANEFSVQSLPEKETEQALLLSDPKYGLPTEAPCDHVGSQSSDADEHLAAPDNIHAESKEAPPARQLSPDKLLRAALLKGRFADTILKAKEKTLPLSKSNKADPEKLRKEREELEKRQRQERARLQAEAKAAELARKKAEADAASEVRRKREEEREAARLALQQMERTVEFNQEIELSKDLEILTNVPPEQLSSSGGEVSPASSPDGFPPFGFQSGNPLEQLGLFMKDDYEDDYEKQGDGEVADAEVAFENEDVEEGEIDQ